MSTGTRSSTKIKAGLEPCGHVFGRWWEPGGVGSAPACCPWPWQRPPGCQLGALPSLFLQALLGGSVSESDKQKPRASTTGEGGTPQPRGRKWGSSEHGFHSQTAKGCAPGGTPGEGPTLPTLLHPLWKVGL